MQVIGRQAQLLQMMEHRQHLVGEVLHVGHVDEVESLDRLAKMMSLESANGPIEIQEIPIHAKKKIYLGFMKGRGEGGGLTGLETESERDEI